MLMNCKYLINCFGTVLSRWSNTNNSMQTGIPQHEIFLRNADMRDAEQLIALNKAFRAEMMIWEKETEPTPTAYPILDSEDVDYILNEEESSSLIVVGRRGQDSSEKLIGYLYAYLEAWGKETKSKPRRTHSPRFRKKNQRLRRTKSDQNQNLGKSLYIAELFVVPNERGSGLGDLLLREALSHHSTSGNPPCFRSHLYVCSRNVAAVRCYSRLGYVKSDRPSGDQSHDMVMQLDCWAPCTSSRPASCTPSLASSSAPQKLDPSLAGGGPGRRASSGAHAGNCGQGACESHPVMNSGQEVCSSHRAFGPHDDIDGRGSDSASRSSHSCRKKEAPTAETHRLAAESANRLAETTAEAGGEEGIYGRPLSSAAVGVSLSLPPAPPVSDTPSTTYLHTPESVSPGPRPTADGSLAVSSAIGAAAWKVARSSNAEPPRAMSAALSAADCEVFTVAALRPLLSPTRNYRLHSRLAYGKRRGGAVSTADLAADADGVAGSAAEAAPRGRTTVVVGDLEGIGKGVELAEESSGGDDDDWRAIQRRGKRRCFADRRPRASNGPGSGGGLGIAAETAIEEGGGAEEEEAVEARVTRLAAAAARRKPSGRRP